MTDPMLTQIAGEMPVLALLAWAVIRISGRLDTCTAEVQVLSQRLAVLLDRSRPPTQGTQGAADE